jgi:hypothetical protein
VKVANITIVVRGSRGETVKCVWDGDGCLQHGDPAALDHCMHGLELERPDLDEQLEAEDDEPVEPVVIEPIVATTCEAPAPGTEGTEPDPTPAVADGTPANDDPE